MLVSHCSVVNDRRVRELVDEGAVDLLDVASATGAGSFCGGCQPALASIISGCTGEPASALLDRAPSRLDDTTALPTRVRQVVRAIEEELRAGGAEIGDTVDDEAALAARHHATRGTVRDALAVLTAHGVVRPDATGHVVVAPNPEVATVTSALHLVGAGVTPEEVGDVRRVLERLAVRCACHHPDPDGLARLRDDGGEVAVATGDPVLLLGLGVLREVAGAPGTDASRARVVQAVLRADVSAALAEVDGWHDDAPSTIREPRLLSTAREPTTPLGIAMSLATIVGHDGLAPDQEIGTEQEVAERLAVDRRELQRAMPVLEHHAVATRQPGPRATVAVATPDPWPAIEVLARALEWSGAEPGQLLHVRQSLEARAVELASTTIDEAAARRPATPRRGVRGHPAGAPVRPGAPHDPPRAGDAVGQPRAGPPRDRDQPRAGASGEPRPGAGPVPRQLGGAAVTRPRGDRRGHDAGRRGGGAPTRGRARGATRGARWRCVS